ncbi:MAG: hypothetical protein H5U02_12930 [Clostridia bacterium]|nr:hypothetical protein [Clostridia bacterium]
MTKRLCQLLLGFYSQGSHTRGNGLDMGEVKGQETWGPDREIGLVFGGVLQEGMRVNLNKFMGMAYKKTTRKRYFLVVGGRII